MAAESPHALNYRTSTLWRLQFYLLHHPVTPPQRQQCHEHRECEPPQLPRSHSNYGRPASTYDPGWQMGREVLQSYMERFDLTPAHIQTYPVSPFGPLYPCLRALAQLSEVDATALQRDEGGEATLLRRILEGYVNYPWHAVPPGSRLAMLLRPFQNYMISTTQHTYQDMNPNQVVAVYANTHHDAHHAAESDDTHHAADGAEPDNTHHAANPNAPDADEHEASSADNSADNSDTGCSWSFGSLESDEFNPASSSGHQE